MTISKIFITIQFSKNYSKDNCSKLTQNFRQHLFLNNLKKVRLRFGGGNRDRTCDLLNANQMLSQLSYAPKTVVDNVSLFFSTEGQ